MDIILSDDIVKEFAHIPRKTSLAKNTEAINDNKINKNTRRRLHSLKSREMNDYVLSILTQKDSINEGTDSSASEYEKEIKINTNTKKKKNGPFIRKNFCLGSTDKFDRVKFFFSFLKKLIN
jgi:hypothetical protein